MAGEGRANGMTIYLFERHTAQGRIELSDRDRLDLIQRMSTNDVNALAQGQGTSTVFTTATARIIDRVTIYHRGETALMLTHYPHTVMNWLQRHVFWQDRFKMRDLSGELGQLELHGYGASKIAESILPKSAELGIHRILEAAERGLIVARIPPLLEAGYLLIAPQTVLREIQTQLVESGAVKVGDAALYESLRVEAGLPGPDHELTEDYIPLEAGLWDAVSFNKGCYIGQEIIARMESRNKLAKTLTKLEIQGEVSIGAAITANGETIGVITSIAAPFPPRKGVDQVALGFIKPEFSTSEYTFSIGESAQAKIAPAALIATRQG